MVREETYEETNNFNIRQCMAGYEEHMSDASNRKAKQKWAIEKPKLDNARQSRGIFFFEPNDEECQHTVKNVCRKLEIPMPAAMPAAILGNTGRNMLLLSMPTNL